MHPPKTECNSVRTYVWLGHVKRIDGIGLTPNFKGRVDLSCAINYLGNSTIGRDTALLGALSAGADCIRDVSVACKHARS